MPPKLGEILICAKIIDQHQLESALSAQQKWGGKLGEILVNSGLCSEEMMVKALSRQLDVARAELDHIASVPDEVLSKIPLELSLALDALPLELRDGNTLLVVAMSDPLNAAALDELAAKTHCRIHALLAGPHAIAQSRSRIYRIEGAAAASSGARSPGVREKTVVKGISEYSKLINKDTLDLSGRPAPISFSFGKPSGDRPPALDDGIETNAASQRCGSDIAREETSRDAKAVSEQTWAMLNALIETLIQKEVFSREEFLKNLSNSKK